MPQWSLQDRATQRVRNPLGLVTNREPAVTRIWFETEPIIHDGRKIGDEFNTVTDFWNYHPYYMDQLELGVRVSDYINSPAEEQMLDDLQAGIFGRCADCGELTFYSYLDEDYVHKNELLCFLSRKVGNYDRKQARA